MTFLAEPLQVPSLKEACIGRLEGLILSGQLRIGERLPAERQLAEMLAVSRPVVHEALVDLAAKGLVEIVPRRGVFVSDFRTTGSCSLLTTLLAYHEGELDHQFFQSLADMRLLMETETARLAATQRRQDHLELLAAHLASESDGRLDNAEALAEADFAFHQLVALASGNLMYLLIINSFKPVYTNLTGKFFRRHSPGPVIEQVFDYHRQLVAAIERQDEEAAAAVMAEMLQHGERHLQEAT